MNQTSIDFARKITDQAIQAAVDHANAIHECWSDQAFEFLKGYIEINPVFMAEDIRNASVGIVPQPPSDRAWGGVMRRAVCAGLIFKAGIQTVKNLKAHRANAALWKSTRVKHDRVWRKV